MTSGMMQTDLLSSRVQHLLTGKTGRVRACFISTGGSFFLVIQWDEDSALSTVCVGQVQVIGG